MAESKPTKLQMAKEIQYLIAAAQDMSAVMDLDPVIKTDYLIDLKNKTVTATHLQNVVSNLQADIKRDASMIEPEDKFQPGTHAVLCNLNIKVPRPSVKKEVVEDEGDDVMPTPSPPMEEEVKKKEKKASTPKKLPGTTFVGRLICDDPDATFEQLKARMDSEGYTLSDSSIKTVMADIGKVVRYLIETGNMS